MVRKKNKTVPISIGDSFEINRIKKTQFVPLYSCNFLARERGMLGVDQFMLFSIISLHDCFIALREALSL